MEFQLTSTKHKNWKWKFITPTRGNFNEKKKKIITSEMMVPYQITPSNHF
jgi:hypothetical protein